MIFKFYNPILEPKSILPVLFTITAFKVCYIFNIKIIRNLYGKGWITFWENHIETYYCRSFLKLKRSLNRVNILLFKIQRQSWKRRQEVCKSQRWWITSRNHVFRTQQVRCTGELVANMTACTSPMESWGQTTLTIAGEVDTESITNWEDFVICHLQGKSEAVFFYGMNTEYPLQGRCHTQR